MAVFPLPKWTHPDFRIPGKKPVGDVEVDWSNPLTRKLKYLWAFLPGHGVKELVSGNTLTITASGSPFTAEGDFVSDATTILDVPNELISWPYTFSVTMKSRDVSGSQILFPSTGSIFGLFFSGTTAYHRPKDGYYSQWDGQTRTVGEWESWSVSRFSETAAELYHNGASQGPKTASSGQWTSANTLDVQEIAGTTWPVLADIRMVAVWERDVGGQEQKSFYENPYQILKPANPLFVFTDEGVAPPAGSIAPLSHHHRFHNMAG